MSKNNFLYSPFCHSDSPTLLPPHANPPTHYKGDSCTFKLNVYTAIRLLPGPPSCFLRRHHPNEPSRFVLIFLSLSPSLEEGKSLPPLLHAHSPCSNTHPPWLDDDDVKRNPTACSPFNHQPTNQPTTGAGRRLCRRLARGIRN